MSKQHRSLGIALPYMREVRESRKVDLADLARDTGYDYSFLWKIEKGVAKAGKNSLDAIVARLETTEKELRDGIQSPE